MPCLPLLWRQVIVAEHWLVYLQSLSLSGFEYTYNTPWPERNLAFVDAMTVLTGLTRLRLGLAWDVPYIDGSNTYVARATSKAVAFLPSLRYTGPVLKT